MAKGAVMDAVQQAEADPDVDVFKVAVVFSKREGPDQIRQMIARSLREQADRMERGTTPIPDYSLNSGGQ